MSEKRDVTALTFDTRLRDAVKRWVMSKHNEFEQRITRRIHDLDQIERAWFDHLPGYAFSEYTEESPEAAIEYAYVDMAGKRQFDKIIVEGRDVGEFLGELFALMEDE